MKKLFLFLACTSLTAASLSAADNGDQKAAEALFKEGEQKFGIYDENQTKLLMQQPVDTMTMGNALLEAYEACVKALPLDTVLQTNKDGSFQIDKKTGKPKFKTKYSKKIVNMISGHHNDFMIVGQLFNETNKYDLAAKAWGIYASMPSADFLGENKPVLADSVIAEFRYYQGVMYYQAKDNENAIKAFYQALDKGYKYKESTDLLKFLISLEVDKYMQAGDYDKGHAIIDEAIIKCPKEAIFIMFKGILVETQTDDIEQAIKYYKEACEKDPTLAMAQYHVGRYYNNKAVNLMNAEENQSLTNDELGEIINPICLQAKPYLERAVELDTEGTNSEAKRMLDWVNDRLAK